MATIDPPAATPLEITAPDGTPIVCWRSGEGPPLVLVHGATADHTRWRTVAPLLEPHATLYAMDRRGRGASGDSSGYALERECEDVAAVAEALGEPVDVLGHSYGGMVALGAPRLTNAIRCLVLYEPVAGLEPPTVKPGLVERMRDLLGQGQREAVLEVLFREEVGMPQEELAVFRSLPAWQARNEAAHTVIRELEAVERYEFDPVDAATVNVPILLLLGGDSPQPVQDATHTLADAFPQASVAVLPGQQHVAMDTAPELFAEAVLAFLRSR